MASLSSAYHPELLSVPLEHYREVDLGDQSPPCYRTCCEVWGKKRTVLIYLSEKLRQGQIRGLTQSLEKKYLLLKELKNKLNNPRAHKKKQETVQNKVNEILKGERGPELIKVNIIDQGNGRFDIDWELDLLACLKVTEEIFGSTKPCLKIARPMLPLSYRQEHSGADADGSGGGCFDLSSPGDCCSVVKLVKIALPIFLC